MGKILFTISFTFALCVSSFGQISFRQASYNQCKTTAVASQLPFVVYVTARWCLNCKLMEETTFRSQGLQMAVDGKYSTYKIDFDSHAAKEWKEKFKIQSVPAFLVFDENGAMIQRVDKSLTSSKIIDLLKNPKAYSDKKKKVDEGLYVQEYAAGPYKNDFFNWKELCKKIANGQVKIAENSSSQQQIDTNEKPTPSQQSTAFEDQLVHFALTEDYVKVVEMFKSDQVKIAENYISSDRNSMSITKNDAFIRNEKTKFISNKQRTLSKDEPVDFGNKLFRIQFGVFSSLEDAQGLVRTLRASQPHPIFTLYESRGEEPIYRVVIGKFDSRESALREKQEIYVKGLQASVIKI